MQLQKQYLTLKGALAVKIMFIDLNKMFIFDVYTSLRKKTIQSSALPYIMTFGTLYQRQ